MVVEHILCFWCEHFHPPKKKNWKHESTTFSRCWITVRRHLKIKMNMIPFHSGQTLCLKCLRKNVLDHWWKVLHRTSHFVCSSCCYLIIIEILRVNFTSMNSDLRGVCYLLPLWSEPSSYNAIHHLIIIIKTNQLTKQFVTISPKIYFFIAALFMWHIRYKFRATINKALSLTSTNINICQPIIDLLNNIFFLLYLNCETRRCF